MSQKLVILVFSLASSAHAWMTPSSFISQRFIQPQRSVGSRNAMAMSAGNLHGQNACFLPLLQCDQDFYAPRIVQIAGTYPGITSEEFFSVTSDPPAELGQWTYDFSDSDGPQVGTVAIPGSNLVSSCEDPAVIIAEHNSLGISLSEKIEDEVDLIVLVDRAAQTFAERKFLVYDVPGEGLKIGAFATKADMPQGCKILGQVQLTMIPWLPSMKSTKTGFMEEDEYF